MKKYASLLLGILLSAVANAQTPPITPAWALGHFVWEDSLNNTRGTERIVQLYLDRGIPVDGVIVDSPWSLSYNDFEWDPKRYADPQQMIRNLAEKNVRVVLWLTGNVNEQCKDTRNQSSEAYRYAREHNYGVNNSEPYKWWKGTGIHIDFTNPDAVAWWNGQLDKVFTDNVSGWKVDQGEVWLDSTVTTRKGVMSNMEFRHYYYDAMYDYTVNRKKDGIIIARPFSHQGGLEASVEKMSLGWCGDFSGDWNGLRKQIDNVYRSAAYGYGAVATEVGGFFMKKSNGEQLARYIQFGSMTAAMINGGENGAFSNHLPWYHGQEVMDIYAECVERHKKLVPYIFSVLVDCHRYGGSLIQQASVAESSHCLGPDIFAKFVTSNDHHVSYRLPVEGMWKDVRTGKVYEAGTQLSEDVPLASFPLFVRLGSVIPLAMADGTLQLMVTPNGSFSRVLHLPEGKGTDYFDCTVVYDDASKKVNVYADKPREFTIHIKGKIDKNYKLTSSVR